MTIATATRTIEIELTNETDPLFRYGQRLILAQGQIDFLHIYQDFAGVFKVDGDPRPDRRLHLPAAPVGLIGMFDEYTGYEIVSHPPSNRKNPRVFNQELSV